MAAKDKKPSAAEELASIADDLDWHEPEDTTPRHQCPCCDYFTLPERGKWLGCPVCYWEDSGHDVDDLDSPSSENHGMTLRQARANFQKFGACEEKMVEHVCSKSERKAFTFKPRTSN